MKNFSLLETGQGRLQLFKKLNRIEEAHTRNKGYQYKDSANLYYEYETLKDIFNP